MPEHASPPLTAAEKAARERRLQVEHERYVKSVATMRSLPRLQSTIAGAGGKTNELVRVAEERETERRQRMQAEADRAMQQKEAVLAHQVKVQALEARQKKKRERTAKKKAKRAVKKSRLDESHGDGHSDATGESVADGEEKEEEEEKENEEEAEEKV